VQILAGSMTGRSFDLSASLTSIGKGDACKIKVKGLTVGKQAAVITRRPTGYHIAHLEGMAKPKVNGETVGDQPKTLKDGDVIEVGDTKMEFFIKEE
ncbi:MAG: FHA domain-containing protein, partial [Mariprofundaceae bacterium]